MSQAEEGVHLALEPLEVDDVDTELRLQLLSSTNLNSDDNNNHNHHHQHNQHQQQCDAMLELRWHDISYHTQASGVRLPFCAPKPPRALITNLSGRFRSGRLAAIIGPSGAGKTTFLTCLAGRRALGLSGSINVGYLGVSRTDIKISLYSQNDALYERLTANEALSYAQQLCECRTRSQQACLETLKSELNLMNCGKTRIGLLSGGEKRRLSIALELIFSPSILLLDEPTSGLDSLSAFQCVSMLKKLVSSSFAGPMIIAVSIHQPTAKLLNYFDQLYVISHNGKCIYDDRPGKLVACLSSIGLRCPEYHNPSDFMMEVASGEFGEKVIDSLAQTTIVEQDVFPDDQLEQIGVNKVIRRNRALQQTMWQEIKSIAILTKQSTLLNLRDPHTYIARVVIFGATLTLIWLLYRDKPIGTPDGCAQVPSRRWLQVLSSMEFAEEASTFYDNFGFLFYSIIVVAFMAILPVLLSFPLDVSVFIKENFNGWYTLRAYYIARNLSELPPTLVFPIVFGSISYVLTGQPLVLQRFVLYNFVLVLTTILAQGIGLLVAAYFVDNVPQSTLVGGVINIPFFLFTGLLIKIHTMPAWIYPLTFLSYLRLAFESLLVIVYGIGRCQQVQPIGLSYLKQEFGDTVLDMYECIHNFDETDLVHNMTSLVDVYNHKYIHNMRQHNFSYTLSIFDYSDATLYENIAAMFVYLTFLRFAGFFMLKWQTSIK